MTVTILALTAYAIFTVLFWIGLRDPWTQVGTLASIAGTAISVLTLALVTFLRRDLLAKGALPDLHRRMRTLNSDLANALRTFNTDPNVVRVALSSIEGLLISLENKVSGEHLKKIKTARALIDSTQRTRWIVIKRVALTEDLAREIYTLLIVIEEATSHLIKDLQRS